MSSSEQNQLEEAEKMIGGALSEIMERIEALEEKMEKLEAGHPNTTVALADRIDELEETLENIPGSLVDKARSIEELRQEINGLDTRLSKMARRFDGTAPLSKLKTVEERVKKHRREMRQFNRKVGNVEDDLSDMHRRDEGLADRMDNIQEQAQRAESRAKEAHRVASEVEDVAHRAEQKADDTDELVGEILAILDEEGLLQYIPASTTTNVEPPVELSHLEVSEIIKEAYPDASIIGSSSAGHPNRSFHGTKVKIDDQMFRVSPRLHVEEDESGRLQGTRWAQAVQKKLREACLKGEWEEGESPIEISEDTERTDLDEDRVDPPVLQVREGGRVSFEMRRVHEIQLGTADERFGITATFRTQDGRERFLRVMEGFPTPYGGHWSVQVRPDLASPTDLSRHCVAVWFDTKDARDDALHDLKVAALSAADEALEYGPAAGEEDVYQSMGLDYTESEIAAHEGRWDEVDLPTPHVEVLVERAFEWARDVRSMDGTVFFDGAGNTTFGVDESLHVWGEGSMFDKPHLTETLRQTYLEELAEDADKAPDDEDRGPVWWRTPVEPGAYVLERDPGAEVEFVTVDYPSSHYTGKPSPVPGLDDDQLYLWEGGPSPDVDTTPVDHDRFEEALWYGPIPPHNLSR